MRGSRKRRFDQSDLSVVLEIESLLINSADGQHTLAPELHEILGKYIDRLKIQIAMLSDIINTAFGGSIKTVTNVTDALNQSSIVKGMLNEIDKLVQVYFTFPVISATAERSFSSLQRIKTFLRGSMTAQLILGIYVHKSLTDSFNNFTSVNTRRLNYVGHF